MKKFLKTLLFAILWLALIVCCELIVGVLWSFDRLYTAYLVVAALFYVITATLPDNRRPTSPALSSLMWPIRIFQMLGRAWREVRHLAETFK